MTFIAGVFVGWFSLATGLALFLGAVVRLADCMEEAEPAVEPEPLYVPREWVA